MLKKLSLVAGSVAFALIISEITCRLFLWPATSWWPQGMYIPDPDPKLAFRLAPNFDDVVKNRSEYRVRTNSLGFRSDEPRVEGARTIAVFGDSFAFGQGVQDDETFSAVLQRRLGQQAFEIVNTGVCAYSPAQEYRTYEELNARMPLDTIVIQLFENDIIDQDALPVQGVYGGSLYNVPPKTSVQVAGLWVVRNSEFASHLLYLWKYNAWRQSGLPEYLSADYAVVKASQIESTKALLQRWIRKATARNQRVIVLWVPRREQVESGLSYQFAKWGREGKTIDLDADHRWLGPLLEQEPGVEYVDVVSAFRESYASGGPDLYLENDGHSNANGHRVIGEALLATFLNQTKEFAESSRANIRER